MKIFITGGAGFIGHHAVHGLLKAGHDVLVFDNLSTGHVKNLPANVPFVEADILDQDSLERVLKRFRPDSVLHLAARVSIRASISDFTEDAKQNLLGTSTTLQACVKVGVRRFVMASSMAVYADSSEPVPISENWLKNPLSPYGISKLAAEQLVHLIGRQTGMETLALRFFNTFGPGQSLSPYVGVITIFVNRILSNSPPQIFGDGSQCRDFVYVGDVARSCAMALESNLSGLSFNVGTGKGTTINEVAALLIDRLNSPLQIEYLPPRQEELRNSIADTVLAKSALGFEARIRLAENMDDTINAIVRSR